MTTTTHAAERTALAREHLQPLLVDLLALRLDAKQVHWNIRGRHFRDIHLELDDLAAELDGWIDETAERLVTLGVAADGRAATIADAANVPEPPAGFVGDLDVLAILGAEIESLVEATRRRLEALDADLVTQDLVIGIIGGLEKRHWMLRSRVS